MLIDFNTLPGSSRLWVFQSSRILSEEEGQQLVHSMKKFIGSWISHDIPLYAGIALFHDHFLVVAVDDTANRAGGCSVDKMMAFVKQASAQFKLDFFDRMKVAVLNAEDAVELIALHDLDRLLSDDIIHAETIVFNNMVTTVDEFHHSWKIPLKDSWMVEFIRNAEVREG